MPRRRSHCLFGLLMTSTAWGAVSDLPELVGEFQRENRFDYESKHPGLGYSVGYSLGFSKATVYEYNLGIPYIPDDQTSDTVVSQMSQADFDVVSYNRNARRIKDIEQSREACAGYWVAHYTMEVPILDESTPAVSRLYVGTSNGKMIKIRVTYIGAGPDPAMEARVTAFADTVCRKVRGEAKPSGTATSNFP